MRILIAGGGIGGLALAAFLKKNGLKPHLIEKTHTWRNIGYAVQLWENGRLPLKEINLYDEVKTEGYGIDSLLITTHVNEKIKYINLHKVLHLSTPIVAIERAKLHSLLRNACKDISIDLDTTIDAISQTPDEVSVTFSNGKSSQYDMVIGADGIHSRLRDELFHNDYVKYYQWAIWMDWFHVDKIDQENSCAMLGKGKVFACYPVSATKYCVMFFMPARHGSPEEKSDRINLLRDHFKEFKGIVPKVLDALDNPIQIFHDDLSYVHMQDWYKGRIGIIGDAEHAVSPLTGMGCSMAIEDAYVLSKLIKNASEDDIPQVFHQYAAIRQKRINLVKKQSQLLWRWFSTQSQVECAFRNRIIPLLPISYFTRNFNKILTSPII